MWTRRLKQLTSVVQCRTQLTRLFPCVWYSQESSPKLSNFYHLWEEGPKFDNFVTGTEPHNGETHTNDHLDEEITTPTTDHPYLETEAFDGRGRTVYMETFGCQMNVSDSEIVMSILNKSGFTPTKDSDTADVVLLNTCAIREHAEQKVWQRLNYFKKIKFNRRRSARPLQVGILGCMAERLKTKILEADKLVDIVAGPDSYRDLPRLLASVRETGQPAINVLLSLDETYADVAPVRAEGHRAFLSIMRGCNNMCTYCIVPFTRGRERSRSFLSIIDEIKMLSDQGVREVMLLGQNVNSYNYVDPDSATARGEVQLAEGFETVYRRPAAGQTFTELVDRVSRVDPEMRIRFTSPHPKDFPLELLTLIKERPNVCNQIHIPAQSGSSSVLQRMRCGYTREAYLQLAETIRSLIPGVALSTDFITGFCGETEDEHQDTLSLMDIMKYEQVFLFAYSLREKTPAHRQFQDDVPMEVKKRRLAEINATYQRHSQPRNHADAGNLHLVLIDGISKRASNELCGRTDTNKSVFFLDDLIAKDLNSREERVRASVGDYVAVHIDSSTGQGLRATPLAMSSIQQFDNQEYQRQLRSLVNQQKNDKMAINAQI